MIDEKIYTQEDLNNAVTKAISEMTEVLQITREALSLASEDLRNFGVCTPEDESELCLANCSECISNHYLKKARDYSDYD